MPRPAKHTRGEVTAAIVAAAGNLSQAATALGISREAVRTRIGRDVEIRRTLRTARKGARVVAVCPSCGGSGVAT